MVKSSGGHLIVSVVLLHWSEMTHGYVYIFNKYFFLFGYENENWMNNTSFLHWEFANRHCLTKLLKVVCVNAVRKYSIFNKYFESHHQITADISTELTLKSLIWL